MGERDEYSPFKVIHHLDKLDEMKQGKQIVPVHIHLVISNRCNQNCVACAYRMKSYSSNETFDTKDMLSYEKIIETLDCFVEMGGKAIQLTGGGEPLVHPRIKDILRYAFGKGLKVAMVTNGMSLDEELCGILSQSSWIRVSMDSYFPSTYANIRRVRNENFYITLGNIKNLIRYKKDNIIGVGFVVQRENYPEILKAAEYFKKIGVDNFRISAVFTNKGFNYFSDFIYEAKRLAEEAENLSDENYTVFNLFNDRIKDLFYGKQGYDYCPSKELIIYIGADYNVYTCCVRAYNKKGLIGSIKNQSFRDLWFSEEKTQMYKEHNPQKYCQLPCMYKGKNEFINYYLENNPKHIDFI